MVIRQPDDVLQTVIEEAYEQYGRSHLSLLLSSIAASLILGFAAEIALEYSLTGMSKRLIIALFYPLGFIVCILSETQLFTEHTVTAVYTVLNKKAKLKYLLYLWITILIGNFIGTLTSSLLISLGSSAISPHHSIVGSA